jgi:hypothetical protein
MKTNFLEWIVQREELKEAAKHAYQRGTVSPADPRQGDIVITNAKSFMSTLITKARGKLKNDGKSSLGRQGVSKSSIVGMDRNGMPVVQSTSFERGAKTIDPKHLLDVTHAFDDGNTLVKELETRQGVFVYNHPRSKKYTSHTEVQAMWERWWEQTARPQAAETGEDLQTTAVRSQLFGDDQYAKDQQNQMATEHKHKQAREVLEMIKGLMSGKAVGGMGYDQVLQLMKNMVSEPEDVQWLRRNDYGDIVDILHDTGLSAQIAGEENGPPVHDLNPQDSSQQQGDFDKLFNQPQPGGSPAVDPAVSQAAGQHTGQHQQQPASDDDEFWQRMRQQNACYDPSITSKTRHWKRHNDTKTYAYFAD